MPKNIMGARAKAAAAAPAPAGGGVVISPNLNEEHDFINHNGDKVKPFTKQIIEKNDPGYVPTAQEIAAAQKKGKQEAGKEERKPAEADASPIGAMVKGAIQAQINAAIVEAMKEIDMGAMVKEAIKNAFNPKE